MYTRTTRKVIHVEIVSFRVLSCCKCGLKKFNHIKASMCTACCHISYGSSRAVLDSLTDSLTPTDLMRSACPIHLMNPSRKLCCVFVRLVCNPQLEFTFKRILNITLYSLPNSNSNRTIQRTHYFTACHDRMCVSRPDKPDHV